MLAGPTDIQIRYDPAIAPPASAWLALSENQRIALAERFHREDDSSMPSIRVHTALHATIETQIAMKLPNVVDAITRLRTKGLDRHDAIHAIASVLAERMWHALRRDPAPLDPNAEYVAALDKLTAASWRRRYG